MARIKDVPLPEGAHALMHNNLYRALSNNPEMSVRFFEYATAMHMTSSLPVRIKEICILRITSQLRSEFEFSQHFRACQTVGVTAEEARAARDGDFSSFTDADRAALALTDAVEQRQVTDALWAAARAHFSEVQLLDLVMFASFYGYASRLTIALGVPEDEGFATIDAS